MTPGRTVNPVENRLWLRSFEDGVWDIAIGFLFLWLGLSLVIARGELVALAPVGIAVGIPLLVLIKRRVTEPRIGRVQFRGNRRHRMARVVVVLAWLALAETAMVLLAGGLAGSAPLWASRHSDVVLGVLWGGSTALIGWALGVLRFAIYGLIILAALLGSDLAPGSSLGQGLAASGGLIALCGVGRLAAFVRRNPRLSPAGDPDA